MRFVLLFFWNGLQHFRKKVRILIIVYFWKHFRKSVLIFLFLYFYNRTKIRNFRGGRIFKSQKQRTKSTHSFQTFPGSGAKIFDTLYIVYIDISPRIARVNMNPRVVFPTKVEFEFVGSVSWIVKWMWGGLWGTLIKLQVTSKNEQIKKHVSLIRN